MLDSIWIEKYRPSVIQEIILSSGNRSVIDKFISDNEIPNLLFVGPPGVGKTTLAKIIVKDVLKCQYLYINASDENGIDVIRSKVIQFAQIKSLDGNIKVIILDECDGQSQSAQCALRNTMEEYAEVTRFILTANYGHRIIPALQSRCQSLDLIPPLDECISRIDYILKLQGITVDRSQRGALDKLIKDNHPDLRKTINEVQKSINSELILNVVDTSKNTKLVSQIFELIRKGAVLKLRKHIIENEDKFNSDYPMLLKLLFDYIDHSQINDESKKICLVVIAEALYRSAFVMDQEINSYSCLIQLSDIKLN